MMWGWGVPAVLPSPHRSRVLLMHSSDSTPQTKHGECFSFAPDRATLRACHLSEPFRELTLYGPWSGFRFNCFPHSLGSLSLSYHALPSAESGPAFCSTLTVTSPWPFPTRHSVRLLVLYHPVLKTPASYPHSQHPVPGFLISS